LLLPLALPGEPNPARGSSVRLGGLWLRGRFVHRCGHQRGDGERVFPTGREAVATRFHVAFLKPRSICHTSGVRRALACRPTAAKPRALPVRDADARLQPEQDHLRQCPADRRLHPCLRTDRRTRSRLLASVGWRRGCDPDWRRDTCLSRHADRRVQARPRRISRRRWRFLSPRARCS
jgi:hypothetical protein